MYCNIELDCVILVDMLAVLPSYRAERDVSSTIFIRLLQIRDIFASLAYLLLQPLM